MTAAHPRTDDQHVHRRRRTLPVTREHFCGGLEAAASALNEDYRGVFESLADCHQEMAEETLTIPEALRLYIDWEAWRGTRG